MAKETKYVLSTAGFELCKWRSNNKKLIDVLEGDNTLSVSLMDSEHTFILGLKWLTQTDEFTFEVKKGELPGVLTKRNILGKIMQLYDPNGYIAPVITRAKCLVQKLWQEKLDWDKPVSRELAMEWREIWNAIKALEQIKIPRWLGTHSKVQIQLHGFADASGKAYGAAIYVRVINSNNEIFSNLLVAKSKVAPIKKVTIPRLELGAIELLSKLYASVKDAMEFQNVPYFLWRYSSIALQWVNKEIHELRLFVANRVKIIHQNEG